MENQMTWQTCSVFRFIDNLIIELRENGRYGTADKYQKARSSFCLFYSTRLSGGPRFPSSGDLIFSQIDGPLIRQYERWLKQRGCCRNTTSFYMRILRACYNKALRSLSNAPFHTSCHPFDDVYTGVDRTRKRAIPTRILSQLLHHAEKLTVRSHADMKLALDIFLFSFYTRGMSFVDIAYLQANNLEGHTLSYVRRKTHQRLIVHLEPEALRILRSYADVDRPFLFPILQGGTEAQLYQQYKHSLTHYLYYLHHFEVSFISPDTVMESGINALTFYVARHTWATSMLRMGATLPIISHGLGHHSLEVTQIYLSEVAESEVDIANRKLIDSL